MANLKERSISGMIWHAMERFGSSLFLFLANLILARLLSPDDFGAIAMLMVFISLSDTIVDAGFGSALVQKKDLERRDCSTIFVWNILFSLLLYVILFVAAPSIARFYDIEELRVVLRIQGLIVPINALALVHIALLKKQLNFKKIAKINLLAIVIGTLVGIMAAFYGAGIWSLVLKLLLTAIIQVVCYFSINCWQPSFAFDFSRFKTMFRFGGFILITRIINSVYHNALSLIIGKLFSSATLGYYNQARKLEDVPRSALSSVVNNVAFSAFSQISTDIPRLKNASSKCMRNMSFIAIPLMIWAIVVAKPLILILFTEKWTQSIIYFQILCIGGLAITPLELNTDILNSLGKSKTVFNIRLLQYVTSICFMLILGKLGMTGLLTAYIMGLSLSFIVAAQLTNKYIGYGLLKQIGDIMPFLLASIVAAIIAIILDVMNISLNRLSMLAFQSLIFGGIYWGIAMIFRFRELETYSELISNYFKVNLK